MMKDFHLKEYLDHEYKKCASRERCFSLYAFLMIIYLILSLFITCDINNICGILLTFLFYTAWISIFIYFIVNSVPIYKKMLAIQDKLFVLNNKKDITCLYSPKRFLNF